MSLPRPSGTIFLSSSLSSRHTATHGARERPAGNERLSPCTRARLQDASKRTRSRVSARPRPPCSPQKFARENRSREPPLPHEHRLTLANVKWRPLLTSFSTLVRICPSSDSATMAVTLDRAGDWPSRSRDGPEPRDWTADSRRTGTPRLRPRRLSGSLRRGPLASVAPSCAIMAVYRPDARTEIALLSRRTVTARLPHGLLADTLLSTLCRSRCISGRSDAPLDSRDQNHFSPSYRNHFFPNNSCPFLPM